jgi:protein-tyrosine-phosphatase
MIETARRPYRVLFLCTGNSARSILAEALLSRLGDGKFEACSAGSQPKGAVHPHAISLLNAFGYDTAGLRSKSWDEFAGADPLDFVFTVCDNAAGEVCPVWPGQPMTAHWGIADPAAAREPDMAKAFIDAYAKLQSRITIFVNLPFAALDRLTLQHRLDEIGRSHSGL